MGEQLPQSVVAMLPVVILVVVDVEAEVVAVKGSGMYGGGEAEIEKYGCCLHFDFQWEIERRCSAV
jgi:hypothetical protein